MKKPNRVWVVEASIRGGSYFPASKGEFSPKAAEQKLEKFKIEFPSSFQFRLTPYEATR